MPGRSKSVLGHKGRAVRPHCPAECVNRSGWRDRREHGGESDLGAKSLAQNAFSTLYLFLLFAAYLADKELTISFTLFS